MVDKPPGESALREAALKYLSRYASTRAGLIRVLDRRVDRWARATGDAEADGVRAARALVRSVAAKLAEQGAIDDGAFAETRARKLARSGHSRRAIAAHLAARGVAAETVATRVPATAEVEFAAAITCTLRRRIGPFRRAPVDADGHRRELGMLARAGFGHDIAARALALPSEEAEELIVKTRQT